jgi:hypothetical protein
VGIPVVIVSLLVQHMKEPSSKIYVASAHRSRYVPLSQQIGA